MIRVDVHTESDKNIRGEEAMPELADNQEETEMTACDSCDKQVPDQDLITIREFGRVYRLCPDCTSECIDCTGLYRTDNPNVWGGFCPDCSEEHFVCENCGGTFSNDDYGEDGCCQDCCAQNNPDAPYRHDYHWGKHQSKNFLPHDSNSLDHLYFGVELETDNYEDIYDASTNLYKLDQQESLFWQEEDGSLDNGIEIISQPATLRYHQTEFPWKKICEIVKSYGGKSHDTETCGLHIHFSKTFFRGRHIYANQLRLCYLVEKFWDKLVQFSRRTGSDWRAYAQRYANLDVTARPEREIAKITSDYSGHYRAVNLSNRNTIEVRLFRGSLDHNTILASIELVDFLVRLAKNTPTKKLIAYQWEDIASLMVSSKRYLSLTAYLTKKGLNPEAPTLELNEETVGGE